MACSHKKKDSLIWFLEVARNLDECYMANSFYFLDLLYIDGTSRVQHTPSQNITLKVGITDVYV